jgi:hypothetical protein
MKKNLLRSPVPRTLPSMYNIPRTLPSMYNKTPLYSKQTSNGPVKQVTASVDNVGGYILDLIFGLKRTE